MYWDSVVQIKYVGVMTIPKGSQSFSGTEGGPTEIFKR